jgi:hypothetical protein
MVTFHNKGGEGKDAKVAATRWPFNADLEANVFLRARRMECQLRGWVGTARC